MIRLHQLALARASKLLFSDASLDLFPGQKISLTGANGSGKSSLFALLRGQIEAEAGRLEMPPHWQIAHAAQDTPALATSALDFVLDGDTGFRTLERDILRAEQAGDGAHLGELHARFDTIGGYAARARASALLHGLGFADARMGDAVADFSGGWRVRLNLAQALMCRSDLLLLDEPTNHLDLEAILWLEDWLARYPGTLLLISHDRQFLDATTQHTLHIEHNQLTLYAGNYSAFERQRAERLAAQQAQHEAQQRRRAHLQDYIDRFRAKATKARQAQSRIKALARMESTTAALADSPFEFSFLVPERSPSPLLTLKQASAGYGSTVQLRGLDCIIQSGDRIGVLGSNGAGKSTFIKLLAGVLPALCGERVAGHGLKIGYFAQHQLEQLDPAASPLEHLQHLSPEMAEQTLRDYLAGFDFRGDHALTPCQSFSGGEKSRLALALMIWQKPNLLLLDEPTNHLDLAMRHAIALALQEYAGAMVLISHDRELLETACDRFVRIAHGTLQPFDGDLDDYRAVLRSEAATPAHAAQLDQRRQRKQDMAERQQRLQRQRKLARECEQLEQQLDALGVDRKICEAALADTPLYQPENRDALAQTLERNRALGEQTETLETRWLSLQEQLAALEQELQDGDGGTGTG